MKLSLQPLLRLRGKTGLEALDGCTIATGVHGEPAFRLADCGAAKAAKLLITAEAKELPDNHARGRASEIATTSLDSPMSGCPEGATWPPDNEPGRSAFLERVPTRSGCQPPGQADRGAGDSARRRGFELAFELAIGKNIRE